MVAAVTEPWVVVQHAAVEGPGLILDLARLRGLEIDVRRMDLGASVPSPDRIGGLVVLGGPMGAYETDKHVFLAEECGLIAEFVRRKRPVLGICLGAQLLAKALGANVFPGPGQEIGFGLVELTSERSRDPLLGPVGPSLPVFHWHGDTFDVPEGATLLASSAAYPHQAFRYGDTAYGLQFHIEPDPEMWSAWSRLLPGGVMKGTEERQHLTTQAGRIVVRNFFDVALGRRTAASGSGQTLETT